MASPTFISAVALTPGTSASPGAQSLTVPSDAQGVVVLTRNYSGSGANLSLTSNFAGTFTIVQDASGGGERAAVGYAAVTSTGSKTLTPSWTNAPAEGPMFFVAFVKDIDNSAIANWIRDSYANASDTQTGAVSDNLSTAADDLIILLDSLYDANVPGPPANVSGWTSQGTQDLNSEAARLRTIIATGGPTTTVSSNASEYRGMSVVSIIGASGGTNYSLTCDTGAYTLTGVAATTSRGVRMTGDVGAYSLTGQAATTSRGYSLAGDVGAYSLTGEAAGTQAGFRIGADTGAYSLTGQDATLTYSQGTTNYTLTAETGDYTLTGVNAGTIAGRRLVADVGAYSLTGESATTSKGTRLVADVGAYTLTGQDATLTATATVNYTLICETGVYSIDGGAATFDFLVEGVQLLGGGPGLPRKKKRVVRTDLDKDSYLYRLLSPELREEVPQEVAEVIEAQAVEAIEQPKKPAQAKKDLRSALKDEGIAYREAYREALTLAIQEMQRQDDEEEEAIAVALASLL